MKTFIFLVSSLAVTVGQWSCSTNANSTQENYNSKLLNDPSLSENQQIKPDGKTIAERYHPPQGFQRKHLDSLSFAYYLRNLPLHPIDYKVHYYNGAIKEPRSIYSGVIAQDIDPVDLQQCADAVMRLRGEYLYHQKRYSEIHFNFLSDGKPRYFNDYCKGDYSYKKFRKYMKYIFSYANTASLKKELQVVDDINSVTIGDVFIQSGNPYGHAIIVVDIIHNEVGEKKMLLAQSYMPAQETQVLINPKNGTSWFDVEVGILKTPEWTFNSTDLRRFK